APAFEATLRMPNITSRQSYHEYLRELERRRRQAADGEEHGGTPQRQRSFWELLARFWSLIGAHRGKVLIALATLTVSTLLGLIPPAGTKFAIDYCLTVPPKPMPEWWSVVVPTGLSPMGLLWWIAGTVAAITLLKTAVHLWGRWYATKAVNMVQADV